MKWRASIDGHKRDLDRLADTFHEEPCIFQDEEYLNKFFIESEALNDLTSANEVRQQVRELLQVIGGVIEFKYGLLEPFRVTGIYKEKGGQTHAFVDAETTHAYASPELREALGLPEPDQEGDRELVSLAADEDVHELLLLWERGRSWMNLYKIFEYIEYRVGEELHDAGWLTAEDRKNFTRTANDSRILGLDARHGSPENRSSPPQPMSHEDAVELIQSLSARWLSEKADELAED